MLVQDNNLPPSHWQIGKIVELLPSKDGLIRSVVIETASKKHTGEKYAKKTSKLTRAVQKNCILPTEEEVDLSLLKVNETESASENENGQSEPST